MTIVFYTLINSYIRSCHLQMQTVYTGCTDHHIMSATCLDSGIKYVCQVLYQVTFASPPTRKQAT